MKKIIPLVVLFLSVNIFWSCEKESVAPASPVTQKISPTESYLTNAKTSVLFAALSIDHEAELVSGWLINDKGELRKIKNEFYLPLSDEIVTEKTLNTIHFDSELIRTIDKDKLVGFHQIASTASHTRSVTTDSEEAFSAAYISYQSNTNNSETTHDCSDGYNTSSVTPVATFHQNLLVATGQLNQAPSNELIKPVTAYLKSFEAEVGN